MKSGAERPGAGSTAARFPPEPETAISPRPPKGARGPKRRWLLYLVPLGVLFSLFIAAGLVRVFGANEAIKTAFVYSGSHFDLFFTGPPPQSYARNHRILDAALKLAEEQKDFRFIIENLYVFNQYLQTHPEKRAPYAAAIRQGRIELAAQWSDMFQNLVASEDLVRNILVAQEFAERQFGVSPRVQTLSDIPGQTPQAPQILARAGLDGLIISRAGPKDAPFFEWKALDGSKFKVVALPLGYPGGYLMGMNDSLEAMEGKKPAEFELSDISPELYASVIKQPAPMEDLVRWTYPKPFDRALIQVGWDNTLPPVNLAANMEAWNRKHGERLRLVPALPGEFLRQYWPAQTPVKTGEIPSVWALGSGSVLGGFTPHLRNSNLLLRAEKWASLAEILADKLYPAEALKTAWQAHLITLDHEGAGLRRERELAALLGDRIREESLQAIASHVRIPQEADIALVVFNALSWKRTETVEKEVFLVGDAMAFTTRPYHKLELVDSEGHSVPFEIYEKQSTIVRSVKVRFRAEDVPPLGWTTYFLRPAETDRARTYPAPQEARGDIGIENASVEVKFTPAARSFLLAARPGGEPVELVYYHQPQIKSPEPGFFRDKDSGSPILPTWRHVGRGENLAGPYLQAEGEIEGVELKVQIQLDGGSPVAVHETLRGQARGKLKLVRKLEFPSGGKFVYGVPFGVQPFDNVMAQAGPEEKGSNDELPRDDWYHTREFDGWAAWRARGRQVTVASEARGGRFDDRSLKTTLFYSAEAGPLFGDAAVYPDPHALTTRMLVSFATQAHAAPRLGWEFLNPLEIMISVGYLSGTLAPTYAGVENGSGVILTTFKKAEDGQGWIARAYAAEAAAAWPRLFTEREWRVRPADLAEKRVDGEASAPLRPFEIRTVRMQPAKAAQAAPATSSANSAR